METPASRAAALQLLRLEVEALGLDADSLPEPFLMRFLRARNFNTTAAGRILCRYLVRITPPAHPRRFPSRRRLCPLTAGQMEKQTYT